MDGTDPAQRERWLRGVYTDDVLTVQLTPAPDLVDRAGVVASVELDPALADAARQALASLGLHPRVHTGDGAAGLAAAAPFDRIIATAATDHIPPTWISQLARGGVILVDLRGSLAGSLLGLTVTGSDVVEGPFLNLPGAFMPLRTRLDSPHRDGESWNHVLDQRNPHRRTTHLNPGLVADNPSLRFLAQLHLAGRRLRGFAPDGAEVSGHCTDGSWLIAGLHPDDDGLFPLAQGGPQRLWDTLESSHAVWQQLGEPPTSTSPPRTDGPRTRPRSSKPPSPGPEDGRDQPCLPSCTSSMRKQVDRALPIARVV